MTALPIGPGAECSTEVLWHRYRTDGDPDARARLLDRYLGLVHHVARRMARRLSHAELGDLVSAGTLGLMRALEQFDRERGVAFSTYAVPRIRGAILDDQRSRDWLPRSARSKAKRIAEVEAELCRRLGREPLAAELAEALALDLATFWLWRQAASGEPVRLDERPGNGPSSDMLPDERYEAADRMVDRKEDLAALRAALTALPANERTVLALYYYEGLTLAQIGAALHLTVSRISQVRTRALRRLHDRAHGTAGDHGWRRQA
jgi:RNA polymerase sigma factor for flagellar operon FliA